MKIKLLTLTASAALAIAPVAMRAQYPGQIEDMTKVKVSVPLKALSFDYSDVRLLDGPFKRAMEVDQRWLKEADVNRFLHAFRVTAGLATGAQNLGGWESLDCELRGHTTGHLQCPQPHVCLHRRRTVPHQRRRVSERIGRVSTDIGEKRLSECLP